MLTALSAWLMVQASYRRHQGELIAAAAMSLALADATAYSGIAISPVVVAFAFLALRMRLPKHQAVSCAAWFAGTWLLSFVLVMTVSHSWSGLITTIVSQNAGKLAASPLLGEIWDYAALIMGLALIGALITTQAETPGTMWHCSAEPVPAFSYSHNFTIRHHRQLTGISPTVSGSYVSLPVMRAAS